MDQSYSYGSPPWDLIAGSLNDALTAEEERWLNRWLSVSAANQAIYDQCRQVWEVGLPAEEIFTEEEARAGWEQLQAAMREVRSDEGRPHFRPPPGLRRSPHALRRVSVAALLIVGMVTGALMYWTGKREVTYRAGPGETRTLILPDSTTVELGSGGSIRLAKGFNASNRQVFLEAGTATFAIAPRPALVFSVEADSAIVRDLGTRFTVTLAGDSVTVMLLSGKVAFTTPPGPWTDTRLLRPGMALTYHRSGHRFATPVLAGIPGTEGGHGLRFDAVPLARVTSVLQEISGRTILLADSSLPARPLTARLDGETFADAIRIICTSLDLEYTEHGDTCILKPNRAK